MAQLPSNTAPLPPGELNYLLVRPVNTTGSMQLRRAELVSLEGQVLQTVELGPPGTDGVQRGGPLRPPEEQLFRVKVSVSRLGG